MSSASILHETATRLRLRLRQGQDIDALQTRLQPMTGVQAVRPNRRLGCITVHHDGRSATRAAILQALESDAPATPRTPRRRTQRRGTGIEADWAPGVMAAALPLLPADWRPGGALGVVAARVLTQRRRLRSDAPAVLLDAASLASLALSGQPLVVSTSVLLRLLSEGLSGRLVRQADRLLEQLLPVPADAYHVLRDDNPRAHWWPLRRVRAGDRLRLYPGDIVPVDGCVADGEAALHPVAQAEPPRRVAAGAHVVAGERVIEGTLELRAETDAAGSRLGRLRAQLGHAIGAREPAGRLAPDTQRWLTLPLTAAAQVFGLTGDGARAAAMLQADPQQGLDLAWPVAREAALYALARHGLVTSGLESIERLATARTLVLQDAGVLACGRWTVAHIETEPGGDAARVRDWLADLAGVTADALHIGGLPDARVRQWVRHGGLLRQGAHDLHLAAPRRLRELWNLPLPAPAGAAADAGADPSAVALRRVFGVVADGRVVATVVLTSAWREGAANHVDALKALGFEHIAVFAEDDGSESDAANRPGRWCGRADVECLNDDAPARGEWLAAATADGAPLVMLHTVLRDLVPPGSLSLTPTEADAGAHGVLLGDPLAALETARRLASIVRRRLRLQQGSADGANAVLMTAAALRWLPPIATALLHHGFALAVLLDSLRLEALQSPAQPDARTIPRPSARPDGQRPHRRPAP